MLIKHKINLTVVITVFLVGIISSVFVFFYTKNTIMSFRQESFREIVFEQKDEINQIFSYSFDIVKNIAEKSEVKKYLLNDEVSLQNNDILSLLQGYNLGDKYSAIYLMDKDGNTLISTVDSFVGKNYGFRGYFEQSIKGERGFDIAVGATSKKLGYYFSHPIKSNNKVIGVVVAKLKPEVIDLSFLKQEIKMGNMDYILAHSSGVVIYSTKNKEIYSSLGILPESEKQRLKKYKRFEQIDINSLGYEYIQDALPELSQYKFFDIKNSLTNQQEFFAVVKNEDLPLFILGRMDSNFVKKISLASSYLLSSVFVLTGIIVVLILMLVVSKIISPLKKLTEVALQNEQGKYQDKFEIKGSDEFASLGVALNRMTDELVKSRQDVDKKIVQRTKQLEKTNKFMLGRELRIVELKKEIQELKNKLKIK